MAAIRRTYRSVHHTLEEVEEAAADALRIARGLDCTDEERLALLPHLLDRILEAQIGYEEIRLDTPIVKGLGG